MYHYKHGLRNNTEYVGALQDVLGKMVPDIGTRADCLAEVLYILHNISYELN